MVTEERAVLHLPDELSYEDGALIACGWGTAWQGILRANVSGRDRVLVTGLAEMEDLLEFLVRKGIRPDRTVTGRYSLEETGEAYRAFAAGETAGRKPPARSSSSRRLRSRYPAAWAWNRRGGPGADQCGPGRSGRPIAIDRRDVPQAVGPESPSVPGATA